MNNFRNNISARSKVKRLPARADYSFDAISKILDDTFLCHIGFTAENHPFVIPTNYGREGSRIYFHGAKGSRMLKHIKSGNEICVEVSMIDGIVLARSAFHHSVNYRSVVMFGKAEEITEPEEKTNALRIITEHIIKGRWDEVRSPSKKELDATSVFSLKIEEASAKVREGGPVDDPEDMNLNVWAGVLPLKMVPGKLIKSPDLKDDIPLPDYLR